MIADKQHPAAFLHKTKHSGHFIRAVTGILGCFDDQYVALAERLVVDFVRLQQPRHFVILPQVIVNRGIVVPGDFAVPRRVVRPSRGFPSGVPLDDFHPALQPLSQGIPLDRRRK